MAPGPGGPLRLRLREPGLPDPRAHRPPRDPPGADVPRLGEADRGRRLGGVALPLGALARERKRDAHRPLGPGPRRLGGAPLQPLAEGEPGRGHGDVRQLRVGGPGLRRLPERRDAHRRRRALLVPLAPGAEARPRRRLASLARRAVAPDVGVAADLRRERGRQDPRRRPRVAAPHRHGPLLRERAAPHLDRLVRAAPAPLVPRGHRAGDPDPGASRRVAGGGAAAEGPRRPLRRGHHLPGGHHPHGELRLSQLPGALAGDSSSSTTGSSGAWAFRRGPCR